MQTLDSRSFLSIYVFTFVIRDFFTNLHLSYTADLHSKTLNYVNVKFCDSVFSRFRHFSEIPEAVSGGVKIRDFWRGRNRLKPLLPLHFGHKKSTREECFSWLFQDFQNTNFSAKCKRLVHGRAPHRSYLGYPVPCFWHLSLSFLK